MPFARSISCRGQRGRGQIQVSNGVFNCHPKPFLTWRKSIQQRRCQSSGWEVFFRIPLFPRRSEVCSHFMGSTIPGLHKMHLLNSMKAKCYRRSMTWVQAHSETRRRRQYFHGCGRGGPSRSISYRAYANNIVWLTTITLLTVLQTS